MKGGCHCGQVTVQVRARPDYLNECNCSVCMKLGALWGYFPASAVEVAGETRAYQRADVATPRLNYAFCGRCGATINWSLIGPEAADRMGVNMRLFDPAALKGTEMRFGDRRNHGRGSEHYYREPVIFDGAGA